jgi:hypothetical protein
MPAGLPIRLVQENGKLIELDATSMTLTTERKVGGAPIPFTGSLRMGADFNVNTALINIQGVIVDDREGSSSAKANAIVNFGRKSGSSVGVPWASYANIRALLDSLATYRKLRLGATDGSVNDISFTESGSLISGEVAAYSSNGGAGSTPTILVFLSSDLQSASDTTVDNAQNLLAKKIASAIVSYISAQLSSKFTASLVNTSNQEGNRDAYGVKITQAVFGRTGNNYTPGFIVSGSTNVYNSAAFNTPEITHFSGGTTGGKKSAGDKVMDLYGILNNSVTDAGRKLAGGVALIGGIAGAVASIGTGPGAVAGVSAGGSVALAGLNVLVNPLDNDEKDYIIGIQIPYNSTITASDGELYTARNFFMPTGFGKHGLDKTSVNNTKPASVDFDTGNAFTGIQGAVQKMDISYDAGETVYNFNMLFAPVDVLI